MPELCYNCHGSTSFTQKTVHGLLKAGNCLQGYLPHISRSESLLEAGVPELFYKCYQQEKHYSNKMPVHHPLKKEGQCLSCHNPHSTPSLSLLKKDFPAICFNCHIDYDFKDKKYYHAPAMGQCTSCLEPHQSQQRKPFMVAVPDSATAEEI